MVEGSPGRQSRVVVSGKLLRGKHPGDSAGGGPPGKASSALLLKRSLALTFHLSWATGKVFISFSVGD